jgi:hypothetical protein
LEQILKKIRGGVLAELRIVSRLTEDDRIKRILWQRGCGTLTPPKALQRH